MYEMIGSQLRIAIVLFATCVTPHEAFVSHQHQTIGKKQVSLETGCRTTPQRPRVVLARESTDTDAGDDRGGLNTKNCDSLNPKEASRPLSRRRFASQLAGTAGALCLLPPPALAGIDVSALRNLPVEGDASGAATRLKQMQTQGTRTAPGEIRTDSGVTYVDVNAGKDGGRTVRKGSAVGITLNARCKALATPGEPNGPVYFSTRVDNGSNELSGTLGFGDFPRGLEEGMVGMRLNALRRIEVPSALSIAARNAGQLPEATTEEGQERLESAFRSGDATLVFEVFVTRISEGNKI